MEKVENITSVKKDNTLVNLALKVSDRIQLESVRLMKSNCELLRLVGPGPKSFDIERDSSSQMDTGTNRVFVKASFTLKMFESDGDKEKPYAIIQATFLLVYDTVSLDGISDEAAGLFGETNGIFNAWPYWREFAQNTIIRMGLPPLTIPVFRIFPPKEIAPSEPKKIEDTAPEKTKKATKKVAAKLKKTTK